MIDKFNNVTAEKRMVVPTKRKNNCMLWQAILDAWVNAHAIYVEYLGDDYKPDKHKWSICVTKLWQDYISDFDAQWGGELTRGGIGKSCQRQSA